MMTIKKRIRNVVHFFYALIGAVRYGFPSNKLFVIGITGTSGKSTTTVLLRQLLEEAGFRVGSLSTVDFYVAGKKKINDKKMTMLGKMQIQKYLRQMVTEHCDIAIVETTSEGRVQHRHRFIAYDMMVLTNLYPEHIESHGGFDKYAKAKQDIFAYVASLSRKNLADARFPRTANGRVAKIALVPNVVEFKEGFVDKPFDKYIYFGEGSDFCAQNVRTQTEGLYFTVGGHELHAPMYGVHNVSNIVCLLAIARALSIDWSIIERAVNKFHNVEGRLEFIDEAKQHGFTVMVDYAFEPVALQKLYDVVAQLPHARVLHVCGATGGGRDSARRRPVGRLVGKNADMVYVTDEDPYEEDPVSIMKEVSTGAQEAGKKLGENLFEILNRREAINKAIADAGQNDIVLVTGKGSEQAMCVAGHKMIPWDDRQIVREALENKK
jgi:UDP-N-acetylmuramoyl-L-alanyl-D-glutamate--2,6-diaminopimelate ligase